MFSQPTTSKQPENEKMDYEIDLDMELTNRFLRGEITFDDYSHEWHGGEDEEVIMEDNSDCPQEPVKTIEKNVPSKRKKYTRLTPALLGLMGEANLRFVRGEKEMAEKMCHEIIRQMPTAAEPYQTLAEIHESDPNKSLQFSLLAAHLGSSNSEEWLRLAAISKQRNDIKQEMLCYTKAINADPQNLSIHLKRLEVLKTLEETGYQIRALKCTPVKCYHKIVTSLLASDGEIIMQYAKKAATLYHNSNEIDKALEVMSAAYAKCSLLFTLEDANLYLELLITQRQYEKCIEVFVANVGVEIEAEVQTVFGGDEIEEHTRYLNCYIPDDIPIDLRSKLLVCLTHLGAIELVTALLHDFLKNNVETAGDLYMDVEEALTAVDQHELALKLLDPLVSNDKFNLGAVWLKHAECLNNLGKDGEAIFSYNMVIKHAPQHADARRKLFKILEKQDRLDEALEVLEQDQKLVVSASLMYEQCSILKRYNRMLKYLEVGEALLSKSFVRYRHEGELKKARILKGGIDLIYNFRLARGENPYNDNDLQFDDEESFKLAPIEEWELFKDLLSVAYENKKYFIMERLSFGALMSKNLNSHRVDIEFYCLQACLLNKDYCSLVPIIKDFILKFSEFPRVWNLLSLITQYSDSTIYTRFLNRLFQRTSNDGLFYFLGSMHLTNAKYLEALKYFLQYHEQKHDPFSALLIAVTMLVVAANRMADKHHNLILQAVSYLLTYKHLRRVDQECFYNIGRAYQMLSLNNLAIEYYERALQCKQVIQCDKHGVINLTRETAYNLFLLYKDSSPHVARMYLQKYIVV